MDMATKPIDSVGHQEPVWHMEAVSVEMFESLVVKVQTKITFTAGRLRCSTFMMESQDGTLPQGWCWWEPTPC